MNAADLCKGFGVSKGSGSAKSRIVRDTLDMMQMDPNWCLQSMMDNNPLVWMVMVNGLAVDIRSMPRDVQVIAFEKGIIPYIPADKEGT